MPVIDEAVVTRLKRHIERLEDIVERAQTEVNKPFETPGAFVTGRSNRSRSLDKRLDAENERNLNAFRTLQKAQASLEVYRNRLNLYEAGEVNEHGQPRADAPSRLKRKNVEDIFGEFMRHRVKAGDSLALLANPRNQITVKRVNTTSVTSTMGSKWAYIDLLPLNDTGEPMSINELRAEFKAWREAQS